jgi:serine/threonine protein kinase
MKPLHFMHPSTAQLAAFGVGDVNGEVASAIEDHLSGCETCCDFLADPKDDAFVALVRTAGQGRLARRPSFRLQRGYEVLGELGRGGMGVVYKARQAGLRRVVALKYARAGAEADELARFRREAEAAARLRHPNIVQIYDVGEQDGVPYLAMEFASGGTLSALLDGTPLPPRSCAELVETLARAIHHAHEHQIVHRDLKPANILLQGPAVPGPTGREGAATAAMSPSALLEGRSFDFVPKIADFGLAKLLDRVDMKTQSGAILGTPRYMAPEQAASQTGLIGPATDVHALGVLLYEMLTGRAPFVGATTLDTLTQVMTQDPVPPRRLQPSVPADLETVCLQCLRKAPSERYSSALALAEDLRRFLDGKTILARPAGPWERAWKWSRRNPALAALTAVIATGLVTLFAAGWVVNAMLRAEVRRADRQSERADANYREARDTLTRIAARFEDKRLAGAPRLKELRRDVLENALGFYQRVLEHAEPSNPTVGFDTAVALEQAARLQSLLGKSREAEDNVRRAARLFEELAAGSPEAPEPVAHLASCLQQLGQLCYRRAGPGVDAIKSTLAPPEQATLDEAVGYLTRAVQLRGGLARAEAGRREELASAHFGLAKLAGAARKRELAEEQYQAALAIRTELWEADASDRANAAELAEIHRVLGIRASRYLSPDPTPLADRRRRLAAVEKHFGQAEALLERLVRDVPGETEHAQLLARLWTSWGHVLRPQTELAEHSLNRYTRAIQLLEPILRREPHDASIRLDLHNAHGGRAYLHQQAKRYQDSLRDWDRVVELSDGADRAANRSVRAGVLAMAGDHVRAAAEARALAENPEGSEDTVFNAGLALAQAYLAATKDQRLASHQRNEAAREYAAAAMAVFRKLQASGYFRVAEHVANLRGDPDLEPLRHREEYQRLLREVSDALPKGKP